MKAILALFFSLFWTLGYAQDQLFFQFDQIDYDQIDSVEKNKKSDEKIVSYTVSISDSYFPNAANFNLAQPRIFDRHKKKNFIACQVNYFFTKSDSVVRLITYTWDTKNSLTSLEDLMNPTYDQSANLGKYNSEFDMLAGVLTEKLGKSIDGTGKIENKHQEGYPDWFERKLVWTKGEATVELFMIWSDSGGTLGTYRIETKIYWNQ